MHLSWAVPELLEVRGPSSLCESCWNSCSSGFPKAWSSDGGFQTHWEITRHSTAFLASRNAPDCGKTQQAIQESKIKKDKLSPGPVGEMTLGRLSLECALETNLPTGAQLRAVGLGGI